MAKNAPSNPLFVEGVEGSGLNVSGVRGGLTSRGLQPLSDIPDSGDLQARFTAKSLSTTSNLSTWGDETGNGYSLSGDNNNPAVITDSNGDIAVEFDNSNSESMSNSSIPLSQPYTVFLLTKPESAVGTDVIFGSESSNFAQMRYEDSDSDVDLFAGSEFDSGLNVGSGTLTALGGVFDSSNSYIRVDGTTTTGDAGTNDPTGYRVSANKDIGNFGGQNVREILVYNLDKRSIASEVDDYWDNEWGYTV